MRADLAKASATEEVEKRLGACVLGMKTQAAKMQEKGAHPEDDLDAVAGFQREPHPNEK
jgi:hypothetical protein